MFKRKLQTFKGSIKSGENFYFKVWGYKSFIRHKYFKKEGIFAQSFNKKRNN